MKLGWRQRRRDSVLAMAEASEHCSVSTSCVTNIIGNFFIH